MQIGQINWTLRIHRPTQFGGSDGIALAAGECWQAYRLRPLSPVCRVFAVALVLVAKMYGRWGRRRSL